MRQFIQAEMDIIVISPIVNGGWEEVLSEAKAAGIPVLLSDRKIDTTEEDLYMTFIGADFIEEGQRAMRWVRQNVPEGSAQAPVQILEIQGTLEATPTIERATDLIQGIFAHNDDMAIGAVQALEEQGYKPGEDVKIVSVAGIKEALQLLQAGKINCVVECSPLLGPQLMKAIKDYMDGKELPLRIITDEVVFTADNVASELPKRKY